jgi:hypothetical protein
MSMVREITYKASIQADGAIFNEGIEMRVEIDSNPLSPGQMEEANSRVSQIRSNILGLRHSWEDAPRVEVPTIPVKISAPTPPAQQVDSTPATSCKPAETTAGTLAKTSNAAIAPKQKSFGITCSVCGELTEHMVSKSKGVAYEYCPKCRDNRTVEGHPFPKKAV